MTRRQLSVLSKAVVLVALLLFVFLLAGCGGGGGGSSTGTAVIPTNTKILDNGALQQLESVTDNGSTLVFSGATGVLAKLSVGDVIVAGVSENTPNGLLRKVTQTATSGGKFIVSTEQATLEEAIDTGTLTVSQILSPSEMFPGRPLVSGVVPKSNASFPAYLDGDIPALASVSLGEVYFQLNNVILYDADGNNNTTGDQVVANGEIRFNPSFDLEFSIENHNLKTLLFKETTQVTSNLGLSVSSALASIDKSTPIWESVPQVFTFMAGPVPVVITAKIQIIVGVNGQVSAGISTSVTDVASITGGLQYNNGNWGIISNFTNDYSFNPPSAYLTASLKGFVGPRLDLMLYAVAGPYAEIDGNLLCKGEINPTNSNLLDMSLYGGIEGNVGVQIEIFSRVLAGYSATVFDYSKKLWEYSWSINTNIPPTVQTLSATSVTESGATLNGGSNPNGLSSTAWFEWGTSPSLSTYSSTPTQTIGSGTTSVAVNAVLAGLSTGTTYYYRAVSQNSVGTSRGAIASLTTATPFSQPTVQTLAATSVTESGATLNGSVNANGLETTYWYEYGTSPTLATYSSTPTKSAGSGTTIQPFSEPISGIQAGTTYYFRYAASSSAGTPKGVIRSFTTGFSSVPKWSKIYGQGNSSDVKQTSDGGYIVTGSSTNSDGWLLKTDLDGNILWSKSYSGSSLSGSDSGKAVQQTSDGGYIVAGYVYTYAGNDGWLIKTDQGGNAIWSKTFGSTDDADSFSAVQQTADGGFIAAGVIHYGGGGDVFLIKVDPGGNVMWSKTFDGGIHADAALSAQQTSDGGYIIAGYTEDTIWHGKVWLIKTDSVGNMLWSKTFGGSGLDYGNAVQQTSDGGYIIVGETSSFGVGMTNVYVIKTDSNGNELWFTTYGGVGGYYKGTDVKQTSDGGYIISANNSSPDALLIKMDSGGNILFTKSYNSIGLTSANSVEQTSDGGYIIAGTTSNSYAFIIKTDANGNTQ